MPERKPHSKADLFTAAPLPVATLDDQQRLACLRLIRSGNVGSATFRELINRFGGARQALDALPELSRRGGRAIRICGEDVALREMEAAEKAGVTPIFTIEPGYPRNLAVLEQPPPLIYAKGQACLLQTPAVAIVGPRQASAAGRKLARIFAAALGKAGLVIVSGLARGIDGVAHETAMSTGTVAVVAGGIDMIYPPEHADLHRQIGEHGCIISEMPCGFTPRATDFPRRNRIISGMSLGVLVVEAARRSGTLHTARRAAEQGREVFAIPGHPLDPRAEGTNLLLKDGATLVTEPEDIISALEPLTAQGQRFFRELPESIPEEPPTPVDASLEIADTDRDRVLSALGPHPIELDEIARSTGLGVRAVRAVLIELDLAGRIERHGSGLVSRIAD